MKKVLFTSLVVIILSACSFDIEPTTMPEPVVEEVFDQVIDDGKLYTSKDFFEDLRNTRNTTYQNSQEQQKPGTDTGGQTKMKLDITS